MNFKFNQQSQNVEPAASEIIGNDGFRESNVSDKTSSVKRNFFAKFKKNSFKILGGVLILALVIFILFFGKNVFDKIMGSNKNQPYSAVFLTNGQVYFGKMKKNNDLEIILNDVFGVQINPDDAANTMNKAKFNLVQLSDQLHGPTDEILINRSQVVFYEYLRDDSKVVESIRNYKK